MITHLDDGQPLAALPIEKIVTNVHRVCREYNHEIDESVANWSLGELLNESALSNYGHKDAATLEALPLAHPESLVVGRQGLMLP